MPVGFGFSVGDVIACIKLSNQFRKALKNQGGASDEYCRVLLEFERINAVLLQLSNPNLPRSEVLQRNAIQGQAQLFQGLLADSIERLSKDSHSQLRLGQETIKHNLIEIKDSISAQNSAINGITSRLTQNLMSLQRQANQVQQTLSTNQSATTSQLATIESSVCENTLTITDVVSSELQPVSTALAKMERLVPRLVEDELQQRLHQQSSNDSSATVDGAFEILVAIDEVRQFLEALRRSSELPAKVQPSTTDLIAALSRSLASDFAKAYRVIALKLLCLFKILLLLWPKLAVLFRVLRCIPRSVTLLLEDNIYFEDFLGNIHSLQFQYFKHWDLFEKMVQHQLRSTPFYESLSDIEYQLFQSKKSGFDLTAKNWNQLIQPSMKISMSLRLAYFHFLDACGGIWQEI
ncbi:MAG: hypothetical protein Q9227_004716 [Pyrenula ochraceoflavens]